MKMAYLSIVLLTFGGGEFDFSAGRGCVMVKITSPIPNPLSAWTGSGGRFKTCHCLIFSKNPCALAIIPHLYSLPPPLSSPLMLLIIWINGRNIAITMLPTMTARKTIMMGSSNEVMADTALSTCSS